MFRFFIFVFTYFCCLPLFGQNDPSFFLEKVNFQGVEKMNLIFLQSFVKVNCGDHVSQTQIERDIQRLKNNIGIGNATYQIDTIGEQLHLTYSIEEVRTALPIINFGGIKDNFWFQLGFADANWRGKGQFLSAFYRHTDARHAGEVFYRMPHIKGSDWGLSASLSRWVSVEPLFFSEGTVYYDYDNHSLGATVIRHFGLTRNIELGGTYFIEKYRKSTHQDLEMPPGPQALSQPKYLAKLEYNETFINYHFFYLKGLDWLLRFQNVYNTIDKNYFNSLQFQGRQFFRIGEKGNVAIRLRLAISTNNETPFSPFVADSHVNIRGVGNRIDRGTAQFVLNAEYRHTIFEKKTWASQIILFSDIGTWRNAGGRFNDLLDSEQFRHFLGGGWRLHYRKFHGAILRLDYGIDVYNFNQRGFVLGFGQYF